MSPCRPNWTRDEPPAFPSPDRGIVVADAAIRYRSEAFHGEVLVFAMAAADFNKYGCDLVYRVTDKAGGREIAQGKTGIMFFDYAARKPAEVPPPFRLKAERTL